jgi:predicted RNA-binding protein with PUA-like domain
MDATGRRPSGSEDLPTFDLEYYYDDADDPGKVTVFDPESDEMTTTWITVGVEDAVALDRVA